MCFCFPQDAAGEELRGEVVFFCDSVRAGDHPAVWSGRQSESSDRQLQNRGAAYTGEVDTHCFAGNKSQGFGAHDGGMRDSCSVKCARVGQNERHVLMSINVYVHP